MRARRSPSYRATLALALGLASAAAVASVGHGDDRSHASAALSALESVPTHAALAREPIERSRHALRRAADARAGGDHAHAALLEGLAREWAETGRALVRAAQVEREGAEIQKKTAAAETKAVRARALLEEALARKGRAHEKLEQLSAPPDSVKPAKPAAPAAPGAAKPSKPAAPAAAGAAKPSTPAVPDAAKPSKPAIPDAAKPSKPAVPDAAKPVEPKP